MEVTTLPRKQQAELERLRSRLAEAEETLNAIRSGEVDAIAVDGPNGRQIYTLESADQPHRILTEHMSEGAASVTREGTIVFCNKRFAELVGRDPARLVGSSVSTLVAGIDQNLFGQMLDNAGDREVRGELQFQHKNGSMVPVLAALNPIPGDQPGKVCIIATDLRGIKEAESALRASENLNRSLLHSLLQGVFLKDRNGFYVAVNSSYCRLTGLSLDPPTIVGKSDFYLYPRDLAEKYRADDKRVMDTGVTIELEEIVRRPNGEIITVRTVKAPFRDNKGNLIGLLGIFWDITNEKRASEKIKQQSDLIDMAQDAIIIRGFVDDKIRFWNQGAADLYGFSEDETLGVSSEKLLHTKFPCPIEDIKNAIQIDRKWEGEVRHRRRNGEEVVCSSRWSLMRDAAGNPTAVMEINRDITDRKLAEQKLRDASLYTRSLIEASLDPLVTISREGKITDVNRATELVTGRDRAQLVGSDFCDYFTDPEEARRGYRQVFAEGEARDYPLAIRSSTGDVTDVLYNASTYRKADGEVQGVFAAARDVTELKRTEMALRDTEKELRRLNAELDERVRQRTAELQSSQQDLKRRAAELQAIFETVPIGIAITDDTEGKHIHGNPVIERMLEASPGDELSRSVPEGVPYKVVREGQERPPEDLPMQRAARGEVVRGDVMEVVRKDGSRVVLHSSAAPLYDEEKRPRGAVGAFVDITEQKQVEHELHVQTDALANANKELEAFTYAVAHDLRAPLRHIHGFADLLATEASSGISESGHDYLTRIQNGAEHMTHLLEDLLELSRLTRQEARVQNCDLRSLVEEVTLELEPDYKNRKIMWKIGELPLVRGDRMLLKHLLTNLISNALKFTGHRQVAEIQVGLTTTELGEEALFVRDNGVGFDMRYSNKLFKLFQRLHRQEEFEGTGVGLAIVQRVAQKHGGRVWAQSEPDKGATFYFTLAGLGKTGSR